MQSTKTTSRVVARLQSGLPFWPQEGSKTLNLDEVSEQSGCTKRRIRHLIELGLVDTTGKVGSWSSYSQSHVKQVQAVNELQKMLRCSLTELAWLRSDEAFLTLVSAQDRSSWEFLLSLIPTRANRTSDEACVSPSSALSPFEKRALIAVESAIKEAILTECRLVNEVRKALDASEMLSE